MHRFEIIREIISAIAQWIMVLMVAVLPIALNVDAVRRLMRSPVVPGGSALPQRAAYIGAASNLLVYALPVLLLIHNIRNFDVPWSWQPFEYTMLALTALSVAAALIGPQYVRPQLIIAVLLPLLFWFVVSASSGIL